MPATLSVVLPCYNEARGIPHLLDRYAEVGRGRDFELVLVDNGSTDDTPAVLARLLPSYPFARSVRVEKNVGYGHGLISGLKSAEGEVLAWSHADLQTDPADVFRAYDISCQDEDPARLVVKGCRYGRRLQERVISKGMQLAALVLLRRWLVEINAQPKVFHRDLLRHLAAPPTDFNFDVYVLYQARRHGWRIRHIDVLFPPRRYGQSNWAATWRSKVRTIRRSFGYMFRLGCGLLPQTSQRGDRERAEAGGQEVALPGKGSGPFSGVGETK
jgi:glycosyltransferase involved in cell wall biosynthesis